MLSSSLFARITLLVFGILAAAALGVHSAQAQRATDTEGSCRVIPKRYGAETVWFGKIVAAENVIRENTSFRVSNRVRCFTTAAACDRWLKQRAARSRFVEFGGCNRGGSPTQSIFKRQSRGFF